MFVSHFVTIISFFLDMQEVRENIREIIIQEICGILGEKIAP